MKILHIEARKKFDLTKIDFRALDSLHGKIVSLAASVQYLDLISPVKKYLEANNKKVILKKGAFYEGQVLGCNSNAFDAKADILLLLCDGKFHAFNNAIQLQKEIYVFNGDTIEKISRQDIEDYNKKLKGKQMKFLSSKIVGLLVSNKIGQKSKSIYIVKKKLESMGKEVYVFESDNINIAEFENFPDIEIWVNTACYGLGLDDKRIINLSDIVGFL